MKTLLVVRHGSAELTSVRDADFLRKLNNRGLQEAKEVANRLHKKQMSIQRIFSSSAVRATETAAIFAQELQVPSKEILEMDTLYLASQEHIYQIITQIDDSINTALLIGHNPGITDFSQSLCRNVRIDNMPPCGIFCVAVNITTWKGFTTTERHFIFFDYPSSLV